MSKPTILAFDVFGTVFDMANVPREEIRNYVRHVKDGLWMPLNLPESWRTLPAHPDAAEGIAKLRERFTVVTMTNCPVGMLVDLSKHNGISWDAIIPIEMNKVFKPAPGAYMTACQLLRCEPFDVGMVTANPDFGDVEAAESLGMTPIVIRQPGTAQTIIELSEAL